MERAILAIAAAVYLFSGNAALATTGPGCFQVVNVASWDVLNMRSGPSASNPIMDHLPPGRHGIISQSGLCIPAHVALRSRWCPVTHYSGDRTTSGWVKRHFVAPSDCP